MFWIERSKLSIEPDAYALDRRDLAIAVGLGVAALTLYLRTMPTSILDGDPGRWQYLFHTLGIPYSTTYPLFTLLGKLWTLLVPIGSMAFRASLFNVALSGLVAALSYLLFQTALGNRPAAIIGAVFFITLPTAWWWSITVKAYSLNLVFVCTLIVLLLNWARSRRENILRGFAALYGLSLTNHSTMVLWVPAFALFIALTDRAILRSPRRVATLFVLFLMPLLIYLYVPIRGAQLWLSAGTVPGLPWPVSVSRGMISSEFSPSLEGFFRIVFAPHETRSLIEGWSTVPAGLVGTYVPLALREFGILPLVLAGIGFVRLAWVSPRKAILFGLGFLAFPLFVIKYGHGMQAAFLLPADLVIVLAMASVLKGLFQLLAQLRAVTPLAIRQVPAAIGLCLALILVVAGAASRFEKMDRSGDHAVADYWHAILRHPLEPGAGLVAHSGVLTPLWYAQQIEGLRPDLFGLFPPSYDVIDNWLRAGHALYLAGPLEGWLPKLWEHYRLTPWGILVRIAPYDSPDESTWLIPSHQANLSFGDQLKLLGFDLPSAVSSGDRLTLRLYWRAERPVSTQFAVSLRLSHADHTVVVAKEDRLVSAWYPEANVPVGRFILDVFDLPIPAGTVPGRYGLQCVVHRPDTGESFLPHELGVVEIVRPALPVYVDATGLERSCGASFGGMITLVGYSFAPRALKPGEMTMLEMLWQIKVTPSEELAFLAELVDDAGIARQTIKLLPSAEDYPPSKWAPGEAVRDHYRLLLPADLVEGMYTLRIAWLTPDGRRLPVYKGPWPLGDSLTLGQLRITAPKRNFNMPTLPFAVNADFADRIRLLGYDLSPQVARPNEVLSLDLVWQSLHPVDRRYKVFVHVVDVLGRIRAQRDAEPVGGERPTTGWIKGEVIRDHYDISLPSDLSPGDYSLLVGLYDSASGSRLPVLGEDHITLTKITVPH